MKSDNMIVGTFAHSTSRSNDPQLHTHSVILLGNKEDVACYSTFEMISIENSIIEYAKDSKDTLEPVITSEKQSELAEEKSLTAGQIKFINHILTSKDKLNVIQGDAGVGKTFAVNKLREILEVEAPEIKIVGLGFTGKAAEELSATANIDTSKREQAKSSTREFSEPD